MSIALERGLSILEHLARYPQGLPITMIATELDIPLSGCHRLLAELQRQDYVRQARRQGEYVLTTKVMSLGLAFLSSAGIVEIAQPLLERLAQASGELVRLSIVDEDRLTWVGRAQGLRQTGLRYDPDMGRDARLSCTASGHAWLMALSDDPQHLQLAAGQRALRRVERGHRDARPGDADGSPVAACDGGGRADAGRRDGRHGLR